MTFPVVLSNGPPASGLQEVADGGVTMIRTGTATWTDAQIGVERARLDEAAAHGLQCWVWLGTLTNLPPGAPSPQEQLLTRVVEALRGHPALGAWKGHDEPRNPFHPAQSVPPANLARGHRVVNALDPNHPLVVVQAPRGTLAGLTPYRPAFDIGGVDIYPVSYPPGVHSDQKANDIGVVGDVTQKMVKAAGGKPVWMTLQIAWSGVIAAEQHPDNVPRFPTLSQERFMAYQAIVNGARGLAFFGGHLTQVARPADAQAGWNWTFWELVLRPLLAELTSSAVAPALLAPDSRRAVKASAKDVQLVAREAGGFLYVIAVRTGSATSRVAFGGLPHKRNGRPITGGEVLFEYVQDPLPPPIEPDHQTFRTVSVANGRFRDWMAQHDVRIYRFRR